MVLQHPQLVLETLFKGFGSFLGGSGGTDKLFCCHLVLLRIYSSSAASHAALTHCELMPSPLIMLPMYPLHFSSFSLGSTLAASFLIMLNTSTPHLKILHVQDFELDFKVW